MEPLELEDRRRLDAAEGWLLLGNPEEAEAELQGLSTTTVEHPAALRVRYGILSARFDWGQAHELATRLTELCPGDPGVWVWQSYAARRMPGGGLELAYQQLRGAQRHFPREPILPFNLACYCAQLGHIDEAREWLAQAIELGGDPIRELARTDPDLEPLR